MKIKKIFSIILIACLCVLSISSITFSVSAGTTELELLQIAVSHLKEDVGELQTLTTNHSTIIDEMQQDIELLETAITDIETEIEAIGNSLNDIDTAAIQEIAEKISKLDESVKAFEKTVNDKIAALEAKDKELADKDATLEAKDKELADKDATLEAKDKELADKNAELEKKIKELEDKITALETKINETETEKAVEKTVEELGEKETTTSANAGCGASVAISAVVTVCSIGTITVVKKKENT